MYLVSSYGCGLSPEYIRYCTRGIKSSEIEVVTLSYDDGALGILDLDR